MGLVEAGEDAHIQQLYNYLHSKTFENQQRFSYVKQLAQPAHESTFLDDMFSYYIEPLHQSYSTEGSCRTPLSGTSVASSAEGGAKVVNETEPSHRRFKKEVLSRDGSWCLFCWGKESLEAAHIIAQKSTFVAQDELSALARAGLSHKHRVQSGLLLCGTCHPRFDQLEYYVYFVGDQMVLKVVNASNEAPSETYLDAIARIMSTRSGTRKRPLNNINVVEANGEIALHFKPDVTALLPNHQALEFHRTACLIWKMAGGAEEEEDYCSDDNFDGRFVPVDHKSKSIRAWMESSAIVVDRIPTSFPSPGSDAC